ncbi:hypothetical protein DER46DRAFT_642081 [Fusarium sp. MPI-SDFR-AT-0072]|nr:hypothetical protein DER46DRAFT_642081 [Fusarium sp. MPI-SDFR-AT-0072]
MCEFVGGVLVLVRHLPLDVLLPHADHFMELRELSDVYPSNKKRIQQPTIIHNPSRSEFIILSQAFPDPVSSLGPRLSSSALTFPSTTTGTGWIEHHSNTQGLIALSYPGRSNVTNHSDPTGFGGGFFGSSAKKTGFSTGMIPSTAEFGSNAWTRFRTPTTYVFSAPSQSFSGWGWGIPATNTSKQPFSPFVESELGNWQKSSYQNLYFQGPYKNFSQEELRLADYALNHRYGLLFRFGGPSFRTGFGIFIQRSASGPP